MANHIHFQGYDENESDNNQLLLKQLYDDLDNDNYNGFVEACTKFVYDFSHFAYFADFGGTPASNHFIRVNYDYCCCPTDWTYVHRQLSEKQCRCIGGKLFLAYKIAETSSLSNASKQKYVDFISSLGPLNQDYYCWKNIHEEQK
jgi:hypothetical protein